MRVQNPVRLTKESELQPDIAVVRYREDFYRLRHPGPDEIILLIEVSDSSLDYDRDLKLPVYAAAGVAEVWIVGLQGDAIEVNRSPSSSGYVVSQRYWRGEEVRPLELPRLRFAVEALLG